MTFVALEIGLKIDRFSSDSGVIPDPETEPGWWWMEDPRALSNTIPGSLKPDPRDPETETGNLETEKRVHKIHGTLETGLHKDASQLGGPHKGGRRIIEITGLMS